MTDARCRLCRGTGFEDYAWLRMIPCVCPPQRTFKDPMTATDITGATAIGQGRVCTSSQNSAKDFATAGDRIAPASDQ